MVRMEQSKHAKEKPQKKLSALKITLVVLLSVVVYVVLIIGITEALSLLMGGSASAEQKDIIILTFISIAALAPTFIAAMIIAVMLKKRKNS
jgi:hypothetical protein